MICDAVLPVHAGAAADAGRLPGAAAMTKRKASSEITEETVEGIYFESQHKIETIPGYAEAFKRVTDHFRKFTEENYQPNENDDNELKRAIGELMMVEMLHRWAK